jgi:hypothetical protein
MLRTYIYFQTQNSIFTFQKKILSFFCNTLEWRRHLPRRWRNVWGSPHEQSHLGHRGLPHRHTRICESPYPDLTLISLVLEIYVNVCMCELRVCMYVCMYVWNVCVLQWNARILVCFSAYFVGTDTRKTSIVYTICMYVCMYSIHSICDCVCGDISFLWNV